MDFLTFSVDILFIYAMIYFITTIILIYNINVVTIILFSVDIF